MCVVCGCAESGDKGVTMEGGAGPHHPHHGHLYTPANRRPARRDAAPLQVDAVSGDLHFGAGTAKVSVPGMSQARAIRLETDILGANDRVAAQNRAQFAAHGVTALNFVSSPGSGKTTLLCATIEGLKRRATALPVSVIEGDQQTSLDADRIRATGAPALQINTGKGCHLDAPMVAEAFARLHGHHPQGRSLLFIENVGNLVCPAMWDLGEAAKVAILSVTEGEDKPLKYPDMFAAASLMLLHKTDLLPHLRFDVQRCIDYARRVNPAIEVLQLSAVTGDGMEAWLRWLERRAEVDGEAVLRTRVVELDAQRGDIARSTAP